jgi:hypothetical protein
LQLRHWLESPPDPFKIQTGNRHDKVGGGAALNDLSVG